MADYIDNQILAAKSGLSELVDYQEGNIVSRQIIKKDTGNITLFAFDKGQGLSAHSAPFDAFVQIVDGGAEVLIDNKPHQLSTGETIIMPANISHALNATEKFKMLLVMIK